ncbi:MAG: DUF1697 domain-containing protein [Acidobacteria bacterium]|nr:DUF1697 domain-containing protein [Acidobacteriota bacterium]
MVMISLLRGVNMGPHHRIRMEALREVYGSLGFAGARTLLASGNVLFHVGAREKARAGARIKDAIDAAFGFRVAVMLRTAAEMRAVVAASPFAARPGIDPAKLAVTFLAAAPDPAARARLAAIAGVPEEVHAGERELYVYYPNGFSQAQLADKMLRQALGGMVTTSRNWNTVEKLVALAAEMEAEG